MATYLRPGNKVRLGWSQTGTVRKILVHDAEVSGRHVHVDPFKCMYLVAEDQTGKLMVKKRSELVRV